MAQDAPADPVEEARLSIVKLKQRFSPEQHGTELVERVEVLIRPRSKPNYQTINSADLPDKIRRLCQIGNLSHLAQYQYDSMSTILDKKNVLLSAPTGFGKTEAFLLPLLSLAIQERGLVVLTYPRLELARDQLARALAASSRAASITGSRPRIGIQIGEIGAVINHTLPLIDREHTRQRVADKTTDVVTMSWHSLDRDTVILNLVPKCPVCGNGQLRARAWYTLRDRGERRGAFHELSSFQCSNDHCRCEYDLSLSKADHIASPPNLLVTTIESLDNMLLNPEFNTLWARTIGLVVDEIHAYHSLYGSHAANIVRRLRDKTQRLANRRIILVGSSATISEPLEFAQAFFGTDNLKVIVPDARDKVQSSKEIYYFIRGREGRELEVYLQLAMLVGHSLLPGGMRGVFFFDSLDLLFRATRQLENADRDRKLWDFRLYKEKDSQPRWDRSFPCPHHRTREGCKYLDCETRNEGECWWYHPTMIRQQGDPIEEPLAIESVSSWERGYDRSRTRIVNATSALELGIDDPKIASIGQYKAPHSVFSFIQRVGRGGRAGVENVEVYVIMGWDVTDIFYFRRRDKIVESPFKLPLNPTNPFVVRLHDELERISSRVSETGLIVGRRRPEDAENNPYRVKCEAAWEGTLASLELGFREEVEGALGGGFTRRLSLHRAAKDEIAHSIDEKISDFKAQVEQELQVFRRIAARVIEPIDAVDQLRMPFLDLLEDPQVKRDERLSNDVTTAIQNISDIRVAVETEQRPQTVADGIFKLADFVGELYPRLVRAGTAGDLVSRLTGMVQEAANLFRSTSPPIDLAAAQLKVRKLRDKTAMYEHLKAAVYYWDPAAIIKSVYRAYFYYCKWADVAIRPVYLPEAYFDEFENVTLRLFDQNNLLRGQRQVSLTNVLYSHIPWKTTYVEDAMLSARFLTESIQKTEGQPTNITLSPKAEGKKDLVAGQEVLVPAGLDVDQLPIDPAVKGLIQLCPACYTVYGYGEERCRLDGEKLRRGRLYSSPIVNRNFSIKEIEGRPQVHARTASVVLADIESWILLEGVEGSFRQYYLNRQLGEWLPTGREEVISGRYRVPLAFHVETRGVVFRLRRVGEIGAEATLRELSPRPVDIDEIYLHSAAHLFLLLVASVSGVNPEVLWYGYNKDRNEVGIWEKYEGGAGIVDAFTSRLSTAPHEVYEELLRIVRCPTKDAEDSVLGVIPNDRLSEEARGELETFERSLPSAQAALLFRTSYEIFNGLDMSAEFSEIRNELTLRVDERLQLGTGVVAEALPFHFLDGCPQCLWVPYCAEGKREQWKFVSLRLMRQFVSSLVRRTSDLDDVASVILDPQRGFVVSEENGEFAVLRL